MIKMMPIEPQSSWDTIHQMIGTINEVILEDWFDLQLLEEDKKANRLAHITTFAVKDTYVGAINDFVEWFNKQHYEGHRKTDRILAEKD